MEPDELVEWRIQQERRMTANEGAIATLAAAAERQQVFNERVLEFMSSAKTWGVVALLVYGAGQAALIARLT